MDCPYSIKNKKGLTQWMTCQITNDYCPHMRMCLNVMSVVNTPQALNCHFRKQEENKNNTAKRRKRK